MSVHELSPTSVTPSLNTLMGSAFSLKFSLSHLALNLRLPPTFSLYEVKLEMQNLASTSKTGSQEACSPCTRMSEAGPQAGSVLTETWSALRPPPLPRRTSSPSVPLRGCNKVSQTWLKSKHLFLRALEAGRSRCREIQCLVRTPSDLPAVSSQGRWGEGAPRTSSQGH